MCPFKPSVETKDLFAEFPKVFNDPVKNVPERLDETSMVAQGIVMPLQDLLASCLGCYTKDYWNALVQWIQVNAPELPSVGNWLALRGLTLDEYCEHLLKNGAADGLEIWLASRAMAQPFNIIFENSVWGMA